MEQETAGVEQAASVSTAEQKEISDKAAQEEADKTLAQQLAENEQQFIDRSRQHIEEIEEEVRQTQPLVAPKELIDALIFSYNSNTSPEYHRKAKDLANFYSNIRRIRGDGNCFYRAVLASVAADLEKIELEFIEFKNHRVRAWQQH